MTDKKVVLITGCSSGIGLELVKLFIDNGYVTYGVARREVNLFGLNYIPCDVTDYDECEIVVKKIIEENGRIDIVVNNAGMGISGPVEYTTNLDAKRLFDVNFFGMMNIMKAVLPYMREAGTGNIVNVSSVASLVAIPFQAFYSASKSAIDTLTSATRSEVKRFNINISTIHPGDVKTGFTKAREKFILQEKDPYAKECNICTGKMERDEQNGMMPIKVSKAIYKVATSKNPRAKTIVGFKYKIFIFLLNLMPTKLKEWAFRKMYFKENKEKKPY